MMRLGRILSGCSSGSHRGKRLIGFVSRFWTDTSGSTAIEYGLIAGLTFLVFVTALRFYADRMAAMYEYIGNNVLKAS